MRDNFFEYYSYTEKEFSTIWNECIFIPDTNVILDFYRYTPETRKNLLDILKQLPNRIWIPHQVAYEYYKNRLDCISEIENARKEVEDKIEKCKSETIKNLSNFKVFRENKHPYINIKTIEILIKKVKNLYDDSLKKLAEEKEKHPDLFSKDTIREEITSLFNGKVGSPYEKEKIEEIYSDAEKRYERKIPPGYADIRKKVGLEKYGDLLVWYQIMDKAKEFKKPVLFITGDLKEDWWYVNKGKTIGPRPELIKEIRHESGVLFHMYTLDQFMKYAKKYLGENIKVDESAIEEIRKLVSVGSLLRTLEPVISATEKMREYINSINCSPLVSALEQYRRVSTELQHVSPLVSLGQLNNWYLARELEKLKDDEDKNK